MLTVWQRVSSAAVVVDGQTIASIKQGLLVLCGFAAQDHEKTLLSMIDKCLSYRIFADEQDKMNLSLRQIEGGLLLVPQFTLLADTRRGLRPSFSNAAPPEQGRQLFARLVQLANEHYPHVFCGQFGADMQVSLCNNGPVTFVMPFD